MLVKNNKIIGITGSIAAGKSTLCAILHSLSFPVFTADAEVSALLNSRPHVIIAAFPQFFKKDKLDKLALRDFVFANKSELIKLERLIHPIILNKAQNFIIENNRHELVFIEAALLFESGLDKICEKVITLHADVETRLQRYLTRPNVNIELFYQINNNQLNPKTKIAKADYVIFNNNNTNLKIVISNMINNLRQYARDNS